MNTSDNSKRTDNSDGKANSKNLFDAILEADLDDLIGDVYSLDDSFEELQANRLEDIVDRFKAMGIKNFDTMLLVAGTHYFNTDYGMDDRLNDIAWHVGHRFREFLKDRMKARYAAAQNQQNTVSMVI